MNKQYIEQREDVYWVTGTRMSLDSIDVPEAEPRLQRRLSELRGLGKEIWYGIDAQEYVNQLRNEWDKRP